MQVDEYLDDSWEPTFVRRIRAKAPVRATIRLATPSSWSDDDVEDDSYAPIPPKLFHMRVRQVFEPPRAFEASEVMCHCKHGYYEHVWSGGGCQRCLCFRFRWNSHSGLTEERGS